MRFNERPWGVWSAARQQMLALAEDYHDATDRAMRLDDDSVEVGLTCRQHPDRIAGDCREVHR